MMETAREGKVMQKLKDKVVLVTGASSGIGAATAMQLAKDGARLALVARDASGLGAVAKEVRSCGGEPQTFAADVADEQKIRSAVEEVRSSYGRLDILVNSAGVMLLGPIVNGSTEEWRRMIGINTLGLMYATHAALPYMIEQGGGHIVNISSIAGRVVWSAGAGVYMASKFAVTAFSESLRQEVSDKKIRVTVIEPGIVATKLTQNIGDPTARAQAEAYYASIKPLNPEDIAAAVLYAVTQSPNVNINEILVRPTAQIQ
jgi:NADP-dependent 3-hydroxy acid dehydrogenase YdfG